MSYRKSFLVFILAFAALTVRPSQEALGQWEWDWGGPAPGSIDGGSTVLVYTCNEGGQGTNILTLGEPDTFVSHGNVSCTFGKDSLGVERGLVKGTGICQYHVEWTGDLVSCVNTSAGALVTVKSPCDNPNVSGSLSCPTLTFNNAPVVDLLGISSTSECQRLFGRNANTLFTEITYAGQNCEDVQTVGTTGLRLGGLTNTTTNLCHSDGGSSVDCITPGNATNRSNSDIPNLGPTACDASPNTLNIDCSGNKDNGNVSVCYLNQQPDFFSFDPTKLDAKTATVNGVPVDLTNGRPQRPDCRIRDCNGDGVNDFECSFPTCSNSTSIAADGVLTMITNFTNSHSGLTCETTVGTSGQGT
jgi:hypothetical protein